MIRSYTVTFTVPFCTPFLKKFRIIDTDKYLLDPQLRLLSAYK